MKILAVAVLLGAAGTAEASSYYITKTSHTGATALQACASGFHVASVFELQDRSDLQYDVARGVVRADGGSGPPAAETAWIRTGQDASSGSVPGVGNCSAWTVDTGNGTAARLEGVNGLVLDTASCALARHVWCAGAAQAGTSGDLIVRLSTVGKPTVNGPPHRVEALVLDAQFQPRANVELLWSEQSSYIDVQFQFLKVFTGADGVAVNYLIPGSRAESFSIAAAPVGCCYASKYIDVVLAPTPTPTAAAMEYDGLARVWPGALAVLAVALLVRRRPRRQMISRGL